MAANLLNGTTVSYGEALSEIKIPGVYSVDGPDISRNQTDTTTLDNTASGNELFTAANDVVRSYTNGSWNVGPITVEADFVGDSTNFPPSGSLKIAWNGQGTWTGAVNLANVTVAPGAVDDAMRVSYVFQPVEMPLGTA